MLNSFWLSSHQMISGWSVQITICDGKLYRLSGWSTMILAVDGTWFLIQEICTLRTLSCLWLKLQRFSATGRKFRTWSNDWFGDQRSEQWGLVSFPHLLVAFPVRLWWQLHNLIWKRCDKLVSLNLPTPRYFSFQKVKVHSPCLQLSSGPVGVD